jgi:hypothetical protein
MKKYTTLNLVACLFLSSTILAGLDSKKAAYYGGSTKDKDFPGAKKAVEGLLHTGDDQAFRFEYKWENNNKIYIIPYERIIDIEYGQKAGRRVGTAVATTILLGPIGLISLLSKKRKHYVTIGYRDADEKDQVAVFELGKNIVRTTLAVLETRSGKKIEYQDKEAEKSGRGN